MNFSEIEDMGIKKIARSLARSTDTVPVKAGADPDRGERLKGHLTAKRVANSELLSGAMKIAQQAEAKLKKLESTHIRPTQRQEFRDRIFADACAAAEKLVTKKIEANLDYFETRRKAYEIGQRNRDYTKSTDRLLRIREAELRHSFTDEGTAARTLAGFQGREYDETEALILGSKGKRAFAKMKELFESTPVYVADSEGIAKLKETEQLLDLGPGEIPYSFQTKEGTVDARNVIGVIDLIESDIVPTFEEILT